MAFALINQKSSPALRGDIAVVTLTQAAADAYISSLVVGTLCTAASAKTGYIYDVDRFGHSFRVVPTYPFGLFDSAAEPGVLLVNEQITIG